MTVTQIYEMTPSYFLVSPSTSRVGLVESPSTCTPENYELRYLNKICLHSDWGRLSFDLLSHLFGLLALILCSNCSNTINIVLIPSWDHMLNYFLHLGGSLKLA